MGRPLHLPFRTSADCREDDEPLLRFRHLMGPDWTPAIPRGYCFGFRDAHPVCRTFLDGIEINENLAVAVLAPLLPGLCSCPDLAPLVLIRFFCAKVSGNASASHRISETVECDLAFRQIAAFHVPAYGNGERHDSLINFLALDDGIPRSGVRMIRHLCSPFF